MRLRFVFLQLLASLGLTAQPAPVAVDFFLDPLERSYFLLDDGQLVTDNVLGKTDMAFFDGQLGRPQVIDVSNPFALLLYYAEYATVVVLDRTLNEVSRLDFFALDEVEQPTTIARATDNGIWLFDSWDYRLKLLDQRSTIVRQSNDLRLTLGVTESPAHIYVYQQLVLLHYPEREAVALFTNYGRFQQWFSLPAAECFGFFDGRLLGQQGEDRWVWDIRSGRVTDFTPAVAEDTSAVCPPGKAGLPVGAGYRRLADRQAVLVKGIY